MERNKENNNLINTYKLIGKPLLIVVLLIVCITIYTTYVVNKIIITKSKNYLITLSNQITLGIENEINALDIINSLIEDKIISTAKYVSDLKYLSNDVLKNVAIEQNAFEINIFSANGEILYSNIDQYVGAKAPEYHPFNYFLMSGLNEWVEESIRKDQDSDRLLRYGYVKRKDDKIVQVGLLSNDINNLISRMNYRKNIEGIIKENKISFCSIYDSNFNKFYHYGIDDSQFLNVDLIRNKNDNCLIDNKNNIIIYVSPIKNTGKNIKKDKKLYGYLVIGISIKDVREIVFMNIMFSATIIIFILAASVYLTKFRLVKPINNLKKEIDRIKIEYNFEEYLNIEKDDAFKNLKIYINSLFKRIYEYIKELNENKQELEASNEELSAALEQLVAYEEELQNKYDEIEKYAKELEGSKEEIKYLAYYDYLTGLPNRLSLQNELKIELEGSSRGCLLLLDLDNFKNVNDILGHIYGDNVLVDISNIFKDIETIYDGLRFYRMAGDEFVAIYKFTDYTKIEELVNEIKDRVSDFAINKGLNISTSIGIALYPRDGQLIEHLLMKADMAMYEAKEKGKNTYVYFDTKMQQALKERTYIENKLIDALKTNNFQILYQPIYDIKTGEVVSFEALLRIKDSNISPAKFIPIAEKSNLIVDIGNWVIENVLSQIREWLNRGINVKPVSINISVKQFLDGTFLDLIKEYLDENNIYRDLIQLEITESLLLEKNEHTIQKLKTIKDLGIKLILDDFGTGYSSLSYLTYIPVDRVKLDKSLNDRFVNKYNIETIKNIIGLIKSLDLTVTAEGIENMEQVEILREIGCDYVQGYVFSKPLIAEGCIDLLKN
ncbi:EAL domain-containing protein [Caloramator sp. ALD01]|uniref:EAL domain-containing protein n=1 Tax=Caloramator sp. ALD01 TaxID=1031288 RepID=UPI000411A1FC|nr:EAL domain-containing protein [Caloramator sp. ALD01]